MLSETTNASDIRYQGRLLSCRRPVLLFLAMCTAFVMAGLLDSLALAVLCAELAIALIVIRIFWPDNPLLYDTVSFEVDEAGLTIARPSGRQYSAPWSAFDEARVRPMGSFDDGGREMSKWKLTLMNARKAAISSFINADAEQVMFMLPVELSFEATAEEARELSIALSGMIEDETVAGRHRRSRRAMKFRR